MGKYSIHELEKLSGIKAHTIRVWEKRHNIVVPSRTETNIRYYSDEDLKKILKISMLSNYGLRISQIADLSGADIILRIRQLSNEKLDINIYISQLIICMIDFDERDFEKLLADYIAKLGFEKTLLEIIYPFLTKIGVLWRNDNISSIQEHFISNLIRQKIVVAIDGILNKSTPVAPRVVLFLPENEMHEIGLLFFHYLLKSMGFRTYYLGQYVPLKDLEDSVVRLKPDYMIASISYVRSAKRLDIILNELHTRFHGINIYLTGYPLLGKSLEAFDHFHFFNDATDLKIRFEKLLLDHTQIDLSKFQGI